MLIFFLSYKECLSITTKKEKKKKKKNKTETKKLLKSIIERFQAFFR